jgi:hypothetical protein
MEIHKKRLKIKNTRGFKGCLKMSFSVLVFPLSYKERDWG